MKILIIGGTRFIGFSVVESLLDLGHELAIFNRGLTCPECFPETTHITGDRKELAKYLPEFKAFSPDAVLDMFPLGETDVVDLVSVFKSITPRIIAISSQDVYRAYGIMTGLEEGEPDPVPLTEESPLREKLYPYRKYGMLPDYEKILVEKNLMEDPELSGTILRLPMVYGPRDYQHRLYSYIKRMDDQRPAVVLAKSYAEWRWTKGFVKDVGHAIAQAVTNENAENCIFNVGEPETLTFEHWIRKIGDIIGWHGEIISVPDETLPAEFLPGINTDQHFLTDSSRIRDTLGFKEKHGLSDAIMETVNWERGNPPQQIDPKEFDYSAEDEILNSMKAE